MFPLFFSRMYFLHSYIILTPRVFWVCSPIALSCSTFGSTNAGCFNFLPGKKAHKGTRLSWRTSLDLLNRSIALMEVEEGKVKQTFLLFSASGKVCYSSYLWRSLLIADWTCLPHRRMLTFLMFHFTEWCISPPSCINFPSLWIFKLQQS